MPRTRLEVAGKDGATGRSTRLRRLSEILVIKDSIRRQSPDYKDVGALASKFPPASTNISKVRKKCLHHLQFRVPWQKVLLRSLWLHLAT
jgi:hypothetical protein